MQHAAASAQGGQRLRGAQRRPLPHLRLNGCVNCGLDDVLSVGLGCGAATPAVDGGYGCDRCGGDGVEEGVLDIGGQVAHGGVDAVHLQCLSDDGAGGESGGKGGERVGLG